MTKRTIGAAMAALALLTSCSSETSVGDDLATDFESTGDAPRLGEREPEAEVSSEPAPEPTVQETVAAESTTPAQPAPEPEPEPEPVQQVALDVQIYSDTEGPSQFDPPRARIFAGSCIRWINVDAVERSVVADDESFDSGPIAPGGEFVHCFETPRNINYHDGTRPYAVAFVEVLQP